MGISQRQIATYETGRIHLNDKMIVCLALTLEVPVDELLGLKLINAFRLPLLRADAS